MAFALLAAGASLLGGYMASRGAKKAAKQQAEGQRENIKFQREMADRAYQNAERAYDLTKPYANAGQNYLEMYGQNTGLYGQEGQQTALDRYKNSPSYSLLQDVISKSTNDMAGAMASQGLFKSGAYGKELASHLAPIVLGDYYKNLATIGSGVDIGQRAVDTGQRALTLGSQTSMQAGQSIGNALSNLGAINASGTVGSTNAMVGGINNALAGYGQAAGYGAQSGGYPLQYDPTWSNTRTSYL